MSGKKYYLSIKGTSIEVSEKVYREYMRYERKERYFTEDLKRERIMFNPKTQEAETGKFL